jgi:tetratricopeptide (TPR) repeat protein
VERLAPATPPALEAELWQAVASLYGQRNQQTTIRAARKAADLYGALGDSLRRGFALRTLGSAHAAEGDDEAEAVLLEARPILEASGRPRLIAMSHTAFAVLHAARGNEAQGMPELQTALELWRAAGAESAVMRTRVSIADQLWSLGDLERAISLAREVLEEHRASPFADRLSRAYATANLFGMLVEHGDLAEAQSIGRALLPELREFHLTHGWVDHFASYHARTGREEDAVVLVAWADAHRLARGLRRQSNERRAREFALARAGERVKDPERLMKRGAALSEEEALRLAPP